MLHRDTLAPLFAATRDRAKVFGVAGFRPAAFQASIAINDERSRFSGKQLRDSEQMTGSAFSFSF